MVEYRSAPIDHVFGALAHPARRVIVDRLARRPATVSELAAPFAMSLNAVSKHVKVLERAGLVRRDVRGREHHCSLDSAPLREAAEWMDHYRQFWTQRLDGLEQYLTAQARGRGQGTRRKHE